MSIVYADKVLINGATQVTNVGQTINGNLLLGSTSTVTNSTAFSNLLIGNCTVGGTLASENISVLGNISGQGSRNIMIGGSAADGNYNLILGGSSLSTASYCLLGIGAGCTGDFNMAGWGSTINLGTSTYTIALGGTGITHAGSNNAYSICGATNGITGGDNSGIIGGSNCNLNSAGARSSIINSDSITFSATGAGNTVIGLATGTMGGTSTVRCLLAGGTTNSITTAGASTNCAIIGGMTNTIARGTDCAIICSEASDMALTGTGGLLINNGIYSGGNNEISSNVSSFTNGSNATLAGDNNRIQNRVTQCVIIGGASSDILTSGTGTLSGAVVVGGNNCNITSSSSSTTGRSVIIGGINQTITSTGTGATLNSAILYGSGCTLTNNSTCLLGGTNAAITSGFNGVVCLTCSNTTAFTAGTADRFVCRFVNGYYLSSSAANNTGLQMAASGSAWDPITSDIRTKNIHNEIEYQAVLSELDNVRVYNYNMKDDDNASKRIGIIAQEFNNTYDKKLGIIPTTYSGSDSMNNKYGSPDDPIQTISTEGVQFVMMSCIKGLKSRVENLKAENAALKQQIDNIQSQLATIMSVIKSPKSK
jgi:hypothetical protein